MRNYGERRVTKISTIWFHRSINLNFDTHQRPSTVIKSETDIIFQMDFGVNCRSFFVRCKRSTNSTSNATKLKFTLTNKHISVNSSLVFINDLPIDRLQTNTTMVSIRLVPKISLS